MATQTALHGQGMADAAFAWLYPYDKTVFPRGIISPTLQFGGGASDAEYVHITSKTLDYKGYFAGGAAGNVALSLPQKSWVAVTAAVAAGDAATVQVTKISGGHVTGPISESWPIAQGNIRGTIFYETYGSMIAGGRNSVGDSEDSAGREEAHAVQGLGHGVLRSHLPRRERGWVDDPVRHEPRGQRVMERGERDLRDDREQQRLHVHGPVPRRHLRDVGHELQRDLHAHSRVAPLRHEDRGEHRGARLGLGHHAGRHARVLTRRQADRLHARGQGRRTRSPKWTSTRRRRPSSGLVDLATESSGYVAWPAFTPDDKMVIFQSGSSATFDTDCQNTGDLYVVDVASHTLRRLDALDGYTGAGTASYLPANDPGLNFAPTVLAEAVGGYFWSVFTSHRSYGGLLASKANNPGLGFSNCTSAQGDEDDGKLWVAAIDIGSSPGQDPSHPAFYLDGQELQADNLRGYWVLPACQANGASCQTGDECCCGFCRPPSTGAAPVCVCKPKGCSNEFESCTTASDCCAAGDQCINGRCALPAPPK